MFLIGGLVLVAAAFSGLLWRLAPNQSVLEASRDEVHFPTVSGFNLNRQEFTFPQDLSGDRLYPRHVNRTDLFGQVDRRTGFDRYHGDRRAFLFLQGHR